MPSNPSPSRIADILNNAAKEEIVKSLSSLRAEERFIPYLSIHKFESLLFSDSAILAAELRIPERKVLDVLTEFGDPEKINDDPAKAPSKRLDAWSENRFLKISQGIAIAENIGISRMREKCRIFDSWLKRIEDIADQARME